MQNPYGPSFYWTFLSNTGLMVAVSLLFRYADFVTFLGGSEQQLGFVTGVGMIGAIAARIFQGVAIDQYGPGRIWRGSLLLLVTCLLAHNCVITLHSPTIYLLRIMYTVSLAGAFGSSITFISLRAPENRMGEMIGMLGASGFVGTAIGPFLGDLLLADVSALPGKGVYRMFLWSAMSAAVSLICACMAIRESTPTQAAQPARDNSIRHLWQSIRMYHPGFILIVGIAMGIGLGMPGTFLRTFAEEKGIAGLRHFFLVYAVVAFVARVCTRQLSDRWGARPTILLGLASLATSMVIYLFVTVDWTLMLPAIFAGLGHALLFPATVSAANQAFPVEYRGLATTLILMMFDVGMLIGQPTIGWTVEFARGQGWNGYAVAFNGLALFLVGVAIALAILTARRPSLLSNFELKTTS